MSQWVFCQKHRFLGQKLWPVACKHTDTHIGFNHWVPYPGADKLFCCTVPRVRKLLPARHLLHSFLFAYYVTRVPSLASHHVHGPLYWHRSRDSAICNVIGHSLWEPVGHSTPTAEGRWGASKLSAKPNVRRPPQARRGEGASTQIKTKQVLRRAAELS